MIGRLRGTVVSEATDGTVVVDVGGVGYELLVPLGTLGRLSRDDAGHSVFMVHTHVREDAFTLFGFSDERERTAFRMLLAVAGIGPRTAVAILGVLPSSELVTAVARADVKRLQSVPGVGKRIAERLALELKDKLTHVALGSPVGMTHTVSTPGGSVVPSAPASSTGGLGRVAETLVRMGFKQLEADRAVSELKGRESEPLDVLTRDALRLLIP